MSYSNSTPHYGLPQYIGSDKPTYLGDANEAYNKIDEKIFESITIANQAKATAESSAGVGESVVTSVNANTASIATIQNKITDIDTVKQNAGQVPVIKSTVDNMRDSVSNLETLVTELSNRLNRFALDKVYPIGSIYLSVNGANPSTFLGGTWEKISDKFLVGAGGKYSATSSGGNELLMIAQDQTPWIKINSEQQGWGLSNDTSQSGGLGFKDRVAIARPTDGSQPQQYIKLIPPYFAVYMWKRVY